MKSVTGTTIPSFSFAKMNEQIYGDYHYNQGIEIDPAKTGLVVVDMQPAFFDTCFGQAKSNAKLMPGGLDYFGQRVKELVIPRHQQLLNYFRSHGMLVVYIVTWSESETLADMMPQQKRNIRRWEQTISEQCYRKWNPGMAVADQIAPLGHEMIVPKTTGSAFISSMLPTILHNAGVNTVVLTGINTNGCVFETAVAGKNMGFDFVLVSDATACYHPLLQEEAEVWMARHFALIRTTDQTMRMLDEAKEKSRP